MIATFGGYSKTSYGAQGGDDAGGFFSGGSQQGSQGGQGGGKVCILAIDNPNRPSSAHVYLWSLN